MSPCTIEGKQNDHTIEPRPTCTYTEDSIVRTKSVLVSVWGEIEWKYFKEQHLIYANIVWKHLCLHEKSKQDSQDLFPTLVFWFVGKKQGTQGDLETSCPADESLINVCQTLIYNVQHMLAWEFDFWCHQDHSIQIAVVQIHAIPCVKSSLYCTSTETLTSLTPSNLTPVISPHTNEILVKQERKPSDLHVSFEQARSA